jgi:hypothetical protein
MRHCLEGKQCGAAAAHDAQVLVGGVRRFAAARAGRVHYLVLARKKSEQPASSGKPLPAGLASGQVALFQLVISLPRRQVCCGCNCFDAPDGGIEVFRFLFQGRALRFRAIGAQLITTSLDNTDGDCGQTANLRPG